SMPSKYQLASLLPAGSAEEREAGGCGSDRAPAASTPSVLSYLSPTNNKKAVKTNAIIKIDQEARPHNTPKDAVSQIVAAVGTPRPALSGARRRITPPSKNPTPAMTPWMTLLASASK